MRKFMKQNKNKQKISCREKKSNLQLFQTQALP